MYKHIYYEAIDPPYTFIIGHDPCAELPWMATTVWETKAFADADRLRAWLKREGRAYSDVLRAIKRAEERDAE